MTRQNVCRPVGDAGGERTNDSRSDAWGHSRREFLATLAAFGMSAVASARTLTAQTPPVSAKPGFIDVHHHIVPPFYLAENRDRIIAAAGGRINPAYFSWTPEQALAAMDKHRIATAVLSLSAGGGGLGDRKAAARTARRVNDYAADLMRTHAGRFGLFAIIPLPDTEASLREIEYAYGVLKADGIGLATNYDDKWLGHPDYQPVTARTPRRGRGPVRGESFAAT